MKESENVCSDEVFNEVFRTHSTDLFRFLFLKSRDEEGAKDLVQDVFSKLWDNCQNVSPKKVKAYLFVIANNMLKNNWAKQQTVVKHADNLKQNDKSHETPQFVLESSEFEKKLNQALERLPEDQRITLLMKKVENKKQREIAEILNISEKAVEKRLATAMKSLRADLGDIL